MAKCLVCRNKISILNKSIAGSFYDPDTEEKYWLCTKCAPRLIRAKVSIVEAKLLGVRKAILKWYKQGGISAGDLDRIEKDSIAVIAKKYLQTSSPSFGIWVNNIYIIADIEQKRILIERWVLDFSEIDSYQLFDNAVKYNIQSPNTINYDLNTHHGLRRTIMGGLLSGPAGAIMGGLTANHSLTVTDGIKSSYQTTEHNYQILLKLNSFINGGAISIQIGNDEVKTQALINLIDKITLR